MKKRAIDCVVVGHNEIGVARYNQLIRLIYGKNSKNFQETGKYNLANIKCEDGYYSPAQVYNLATKGDGADTEIADTFSLTVAYLGSFLNRAGFSFDYVNAFHKEREQRKLAAILEHDDVRAVAITTTYYLNIVPILDIVRFVRARNRDVPIIVGGPFVRNQVKLLDNERLQAVLAAIGADFYVDSGEGELSLARLLDAVKQGLPYDNVPNIFYRSGGRYVETAKDLEANDLTTNPVDWMLFRDDIKDVVNIRTSKSCPFRCTFCSFPGAAGRYKIMDLDAVEYELDTLNKINPDLGLDIIDDTFNMPPRRFGDLLRMMIRNKYRFKWYAFYKAQLARREATKLMKEAGCAQVFLGCESGSQKILDALKKDSKISRYYQAFDYLREFDILSIASFIIGFPGETEETFRETFDFVETTKPTFFRTRLWWYDVTAPVHKQREEFGLTGDGYEWSHYTMDSSKAQHYADEMIFGVKSSIHATDYPIPFEMIIKGVAPDRAAKFMGCYRDYLRKGEEGSEAERTFDKATVQADFAEILSGDRQSTQSSVAAEV